MTVAEKPRSEEIHFHVWARLIAGPDLDVIARYNAGCVEYNENLGPFKPHLLLVMRANTQFPCSGVPDLTDWFEVCRLFDDSGISSPIKILKRDSLPEEITNVEDPRLFPMANGKVLMAMTAVDEQGQPHPAIAELNPNITSEDEEAVTNFTVFWHLPVGKNLCAVNENPDSVKLLYRPDDSDYNHALAVVEIKKEGDNLKTAELIDRKIDFERVKIPDWMKERSGTTGSEMIPLPNGNLGNILHGYQIKDGVIEYGLGLAEFTPDLEIVSISEQPLLTYQQICRLFPECNFEELNKDKRVLYSCGYHVDYKTGLLHLFATVKDRAVGEIVFTLDHIQELFSKMTVTSRVN